MTDDMTRSERERAHYNRAFANSHAWSTLSMSQENIRRYLCPPPTTPHPLEYAFHLLGELPGATILELGCSEGLNTVILAALGARVVGIEIAEESLVVASVRAQANAVAERTRLVHADVCHIPIADGAVDKAICAAILHHVDCLAVATEIRRVLKPGGTAVFLEPMAGPALLRFVKSFLPRGPGVTADEQPLTVAQVRDVTHTIGLAGRSRAFGLTNRIIERFAVMPSHLAAASRQLDAWLLDRVPGTRCFASPLVWEAIKPKK